MAQATAPLLDSTFADKPTASAFVAYWTNNGQRSVLTLDGYAAIDPMRTQRLGRCRTSALWRRAPDEILVGTGCDARSGDGSLY